MLNKIENSSQWQVGFLTVLCLLVFFVNNGFLEPSIMEARNFITAREILENDTWLIPTLNGEYRLAKPPFPTWITALAGLIVDDIHNEVALRFPAALIGTAMVFLLYGFTRSLTKDRLTPFLAAGILATSFYIIFMGRQGTWDIYCHTFTLGAIWVLFHGWQKEGKAYMEFSLAGILMGLSFMSKGPVSFYALLLPFLIAYLVSFGASPVKSKWRELMVAIFISLIISGWWPLYTYIYVPEDLILNINTETGSWQNRHVRPFWHYWSFPIQSGTWAIPVIAALVIPYARKRIRQVDGNYKFLMWWVLSTIVLLSIIPEKKERYLMPGLISQALLTAFYLRYLIESFRKKQFTLADHLVFLLNTGIIAFICIASAVALYAMGYAKGLIPIMMLIGYGSVLLVLGIILIVQLHKKKVLLMVLCIFVLVGTSTAILPPIYQKMFLRKLTFRGFSNLTTMDPIRNLPCYSIGELRPEELWTLNSIVKPKEDLKQIIAIEQDSLVLFQPIDKVNFDKAHHQKPGDLVTFVGVFEHRSRKGKMAWKVSVIDPKKLNPESMKALN